MDENENICRIPVNYTESGNLLGGLVPPRNAAETVITVAASGALEWLIPVSATIRFVIMVLTLIPIGIACLIGAEGDSMWRFSGHVIRFLIRRRKLHLRKPGANDETKE